MRVAIHDADADHFGTLNKFPNYALMKLSAYHKSLGDEVSWFCAIEAHLYDVVYSSKIFDFTPENPYLPNNTIKGGTGYGIYEDFPEEIDRMFPEHIHSEDIQNYPTSRSGQWGRSYPLTITPLPIGCLFPNHRKIKIK